MHDEPLQRAYLKEFKEYLQARYTSDNFGTPALFWTKEGHVCWFSFSNADCTTVKIVVEWKGYGHKGSTDFLHEISEPFEEAARRFEAYIAAGRPA